ELERRRELVAFSGDTDQLRPVALGCPQLLGAVPAVHRRLQRHRLDERVRRDGVHVCGATATVQPRSLLREDDAVGGTPGVRTARAGPPQNANVSMTDSLRDG